MKKIGGGEYQGSHPVHGSRGGQNFCVNPEKNVWYCFRCNSGGGPLSYLAVEAGIISCREAQPGVLKGETLTRALDQAIKRGLLSEKALCRTLQQVHDKFSKWLYMEPEDFDFLDVALAADFDPEVLGDPLWVFLVASSGGLKSEIIRAAKGYPKSYSLDSLTPHTLISGLAKQNPETGEMEPIAGILRDLNGRTLLLKDFTTVLSADEGTRSEIYGQLRSAYDGFFEKAFGTMRYPVRVHSKFGLLAGVTHAIDKYTKMQGLLGERFLIVRSTPDRRKAAAKAQRNNQKEHLMRPELREAVATFYESLDFSKIPTYTKEQEEILLDLGLYVGLMRCGVWATYYQGEIVDMDIVESEIPTRVTKQIKKLGCLLAIIRGHEKIEPEDIQTLRRVVRDTSDPKRQKILDAYSMVGLDTPFTITDLEGYSKGLYYKTIDNQLKIMEVLDIIKKETTTIKRGDKNIYVTYYKLTDSFKKLAKQAYHVPSPPVSSEKKPKNGLFPEQIMGKGYSIIAGITDSPGLQ